MPARLAHSRTVLTHVCRQVSVTAKVLQEQTGLRAQETILGLGPKAFKHFYNINHLFSRSAEHKPSAAVSGLQSHVLEEDLDANANATSLVQASLMSGERAALARPDT